MNTKTENQRSDPQVEASSNYTYDSFDFEVWAKSVRRQLLAALERRGGRSNK